MQKQLLERYTEADLRVYAVWFEMVPGDARSKWPRSLLADPRVEHFWDQGKLVGRWFDARADAMRDHLTAKSRWRGGQPLWDSYLLYGPDARWQDEPAPLLAWGRTVVAARGSLEAAFALLFP